MALTEPFALQLCQDLHVRGFCAYGQHCKYLHLATDEMQTYKPLMNPPMVR